MAFWDLFKRNRKPAPVDIEERKGLGLIFNNLTSYGSSTAMKLSAVYYATNQISNSVAGSRIAMFGKLFFDNLSSGKPPKQKVKRYENKAQHFAGAA